MKNHEKNNNPNTSFKHLVKILEEKGRNSYAKNKRKNRSFKKQNFGQR